MMLTPGGRAASAAGYAAHSASLASQIGRLSRTASATGRTSLVDSSRRCAMSAMPSRPAIESRFSCA